MVVVYDKINVDKVYKNMHIYSDRKSGWCKSIWSSTKRKRVRTAGPIFYKKGEKVLFNFQHFVKPEKIIEEYTRVNVYNKPRLVKIKKESPPPVLSKSASFVHEKKRVPPTEVDPRRSESKCEKVRASVAADVTEERIPGWRLKKSAEPAPRRTRRVPKRVSATHNFVYEFDPFGDSSSVSNTNNRPNTKTRDASDTNTSLLADSSTIKCSGDKQSSHVLPKLNPSERKKQKNPEINEIDREVEKVKSDWQALREGPRWTEGKSYANARTRKLYDTLEKMTKEIDKIQKSYLDPKSNQFLHRSAVKAMDRPRITFEEEAEKVKGILFPKEPGKVVDEAFKSVSGKMTPLKDVRSSAFERLNNKNEFLPNARAGKPRAKSSRVLCKEGSNDRLNRRKLNTEIEHYFEAYINEAEKNFVNNKGKKKPDLNVSPQDVTNMLKKFNMNSFDMYEIDGEKACPSPLLSAKERARTSGGRKQNQAIGSARVKSGRSTLRGNKINSDTSIQTTTAKTNCEDNAFMEMGLRTALGRDVSRKAMSRVMRSEFLKKDASLKPM